MGCHGIDRYKRIYAPWTWTVEDEDKVLYMLIEESMIGNLWKPCNLRNILEGISMKMSLARGSDFNFRKVHNMWKSFVSRYQTWNDLRLDMDIKIDGGTRNIIATTEQWKEILKKHPKAFMYIDHGERRFSVPLLLVFGGHYVILKVDDYPNVVIIPEPEEDNDAKEIEDIFSSTTSSIASSDP